MPQKKGIYVTPPGVDPHFVFGIKGAMRMVPSCPDGFKENSLLQPPAGPGDGPPLGPFGYIANMNSTCQKPNLKVLPEQSMCEDLKQLFRSPVFSKSCFSLGGHT